MRQDPDRPDDQGRRTGSSTMEEDPNSAPEDPDAQAPVPGIIDVHSDSKEKALDGTTLQRLVKRDVSR